MLYDILCVWVNYIGYCLLINAIKYTVFQTIVNKTGVILTFVKFSENLVAKTDVYFKTVIIKLIYKTWLVMYKNGTFKSVNRIFDNHCLKERPVWTF